MATMEFISRTVFFLSIFWIALHVHDIEALNKKKITVLSPRALKLKAPVKSSVRDGQSYCYVRDANPYRNFGTSTSYNVVRARNMEISKVCKPNYVWALVRSGTRYYTGYDSEFLSQLRSQILSNHETNKRGSLCLDDLKNLKTWTSKGLGKTSDDLAPQGEIELTTMGRRLAQKFKDLIASKSENLHFQISSNKASKDSAAAFAEGMLGRSSNVPMTMNEDALRFIEKSKVYEDKITTNAFTMMDKCLNTKQVQSLIKEVSNRLGFENSLPEKSIQKMFYACSFEKAWAPTSKPAFCAAFTKPQLQLLEHCYYDILGYYEWGYGTPLALETRNPIIDDLLLKMKKASLSESIQPKGDFSFSSGGALTHSIAKLGLYRDQEHLSLEQNGLKKNEQQWSMTKICPFAGNLIAVMYKCANGEKNKISVYHNERLIQIPGCSSSLCPWSQFQAILSSNNKAK